ncbi:MAG: hypothetical protein SWX82_31610 [Cyanobacteriota bacterium]|nr:hypothetical protein [Cyanobacteriota bacterium]
MLFVGDRRQPTPNPQGLFIVTREKRRGWEVWGVWGVTGGVGSDRRCGECGE